MTFNPKESIDFNGNTGPFIQYTYARICSVLRKAADEGMVISDYSAVVPGEKEIALIQGPRRLPRHSPGRRPDLQPGTDRQLCL